MQRVSNTWFGFPIESRTNQWNDGSRFQAGEPGPGDGHIELARSSQIRVETFVAAIDIEPLPDDL
jgi:hypothetical protein